MSYLPLKIKHYPTVPELVSHISKDVSNEAMRKKALSIMFLQDFIEEKPGRPELVSSAEGSLDRILLTIPSNACQGDDNPLWKVYQDLLLKLPDYTNFILLTHESTKPFLCGWLSSNEMYDRCTIGTMPDYLKFTVWAEDGYAAVRDKETGNTFLMEPHSFPRYGDELIADAVSAFTDIRNIQTPLYFEGGNMLCGDDFFFIGADYAVKSLDFINAAISPKPGETKVELIYNLYKSYFDDTKKLIFLGSTIPIPTRQERKFQKDGETWYEIFFIKNKEGTVQPLFHIDMFITLAGRGPNQKYRVLVGDPRMASHILGEEVSFYAMAEAFDNIARNLEKLGFEVIRNPMPLTYMDEPDEKERHWYFATSNNCLVEVKSPTERRVWLPTYGHGAWSELKKTDDANKVIWESLGFEVIMLEDFHPFAEHTGSVHCIKKYISRGNN